MQGGNNVVEIGDDAIWAFGLDDFTLETWVRFNSLPASGEIASFFGQYNRNQENAWRIGYDGDLGWFGQISAGTTTTEDTLSAGLSPTPALNTWIHIRFSRRNRWGRLWIDGVLVAEDLLNRNVPNENEGVYFGHSIFGATHEDFFDGWMDDTQIIVGHAKEFDDISFTPEQNLVPYTVFNVGYANDGFNWATIVDDSPTQLLTTVVSGYGWKKYPSLLRENGEISQLLWESITSGRIEFADNAVLQLGADDFTIEFRFMWHNNNHFSGNECLFAHWDATSDDRVFVSGLNRMPSPSLSRS